jgi:hypothetical protein
MRALLLLVVLAVGGCRSSRGTQCPGSQTWCIGGADCAWNSERGCEMCRCCALDDPRCGDPARTHERAPEPAH